jgi:hypothetical protein
MSVLIRGENRERLTVMGDIEAELQVPDDGDGRCWLSFSDGTLIEAAYGDDDDCRFAVSEEGAGITRIQHESAGDVLRLDWRVEWVTVAAAANAARASRGEPMPVLPGLFSSSL